MRPASLQTALWSAAATATLLLLTPLGSSTREAPRPAGPPARQEVPEPPDADTVTLYAQDPTRCAWNFLEGRWGGRPIAGEWSLADAQLAWNLGGEGKFHIHLQQDARASILDLGRVVIPLRGAGTPRRATDLPLPLYESLRLERNRLVYTDSFGRRAFHDDADGWLRRPLPSASPPLVATPGHTYLLRYRPSFRSRQEYVLKLRVLAVRENDTLVFRWESL
jgi:hypothetical protein